MDTYREVRTKLREIEMGILGIESLMRNEALQGISSAINRETGECLAKSGRYIATLSATTDQFCREDGEDEASTVEGLLRKARQNPRLEKALTAFLMFLGAHQNTAIDVESTGLMPATEETEMTSGGTPLCRTISLIREILTACDSGDSNAIHEIEALLEILLWKERSSEQKSDNQIETDTELGSAISQLREFATKNPSQAKNIASLLKLMGIQAEVTAKTRRVIDL